MKKKLLALVLALVMALSLLPVTAMAATTPPSGAEDAGNDMAYLYKSDGFSLWGWYNSEWKQTSFGRYHSYLVEGDYTSKTDAVAFAYDSTNGLVCETANLKGKIEVAPVAGQQLLKISYTVENTSSSMVDYAMGSSVDIQIGDDDYAAITTLDGEKGFKMVESGTGAQFTFFKNDASSFWYGSFNAEPGFSVAGTPFEYDFVDYAAANGFGWAGFYDEDNEKDAVFKSIVAHSFGIANLLAEYPGAEDIELDSAATWRWEGSLAAGKSKTHSVYIGIEGQCEGSSFNIPAATYYVDFDANGAMGTAPEQDATVAGGTFTLPAATSLTKNAYNFAGWNDGTTTYQVGDTYTMPANAVVFTAQWTQNAPVYYPSYDPTPETEIVTPETEIVTPETEIVTPKTADAGILLAVSMSILSVTGSAVLLKKKED